MRIQKIKSSSITIHNSSEVALKTCGECQEIQFTAGNNTVCRIQNLSKDEYLDKPTGEIKKRVHKENRYQSPKAVRKSMNKLMDLIRCNAADSSRCKWITLTYETAMTDHTKVYEDGKMFIRRLQRHLNKQLDLSDGQKTFQRITVAEPQGEAHDNSWHLHILLIFGDTAPFMSNDIISDLWGYGITDTRKTPNADGLALYFKAYLSDVEYIGDDTELSKVNTVDKMVDGISKKFIKGERLKYYPTDMRLFTSSRGINRAKIEKMSNQEAMERVKDSKMVYRETYAIGDGTNVVDKRHYKKKK